MKRTCLVLIYLVVVAVNGRGQGVASRKIIKLESERFQAQERGDSRALEKITSPDFVEIRPDGSLWAKQDFVTSRVGPESAVDELVVQAYGDVAIATGVKAGSPRVRLLHVWHRQGGKWLNVLAQSTNITSSQTGSGPALTAVASAPTVWPLGKTTEEGRVLAAQRELNETFERRDVEAYSRLTAVPFVRVTADGRAINRAQFIQDVATGGGPAPRRSPNHSDFRVRIYGPVATLVYFNVAADFQRITRVFVEQDGLWKQVITQATVVASK